MLKMHRRHQLEYTTTCKEITYCGVDKLRMGDTGEAEYE